MPDHAARQLDHALGPQEPAARRVAMIAASAHGGVDAQRDRVGERELHLTVVAAWTEDSKVGDHAMAGTDDGHGFLAGEEAVLVERLVRSQLVAGAEEALQVLRRDVAVSGGDVDDEAALRGSGQWAVGSGQQ